MALPSFLPSFLITLLSSFLLVHAYPNTPVLIPRAVHHSRTASSSSSSSSSPTFPLPPSSLPSSRLSSSTSVIPSISSTSSHASTTSSSSPSSSRSTSTPTHTHTHRRLASSSLSSVVPSQSQVTPTLAATSSPTSDVSSSPPTSGGVAANLSMTGFWENKGGVAGTFTVVGLLILCLVGGAVFIVLRRTRQHWRERELGAEEFCDKHDGADCTRSTSPEPSITHITTPAPTEAYMSRDIHFGTTYMHYRDKPAAGLEHPTGAAYSLDGQRYTSYSSSAASTSYGGQYDHQGNDMPAQPTHSTSPVPVENAPPVSYRHPRGRGAAAYQPSIDSFYGGIDTAYAI